MGVDIGGDDSVAWTVTGVQDLAVELDDPPNQLHEKHRKRHAVNLSERGRFIQGRDPVDTRGQNFRISILVPDGRPGMEFLEALRDAAKRTQPGGRVNFSLPIQPRTYDQIRVQWPGGADRGRAAGRAGRGARGRRRAG
jgi:hypothetical protein